MIYERLQDICIASNITKEELLKKKRKERDEKEFQKLTRFTHSGERENRDRSIIDGTIYDKKKKYSDYLLLKKCLGWDGGVEGDQWIQIK